MLGWSLEEQIVPGTVWAPGIAAPGISQSPWKLIPGHSRGSEERGHLARVVRQDADRILGTATQQAQHGVFLGQGNGGAGKRGGCPSPAPPQGNQSRIRYPIPDCNQSQGISFPAPAAPPEPFFQPFAA